MEGVIFKNSELVLKELDMRKRIVEGYFSSFNIVDSDGDRIVKGAFAKSIMENGVNGTKRIKHLFNHTSTVGVFQLLEEDNFGLHFISKIGTHTLGNDVLSMYNDGIITEHSVGYQEIEVSDDVIDGKIIRNIKEVRLWEGSSLDKWGANQYTPVIKSLDEAMSLKANISERIGIIIKALTGRTLYSDETYENLNYQLLILKEQLNWVLSNWEPAKEATSSVVEPPKNSENKKEAGKINFVELTKLFKA